MKLPKRTGLFTVAAVVGSALLLSGCDGPGTTSAESDGKAADVSIAYACAQTDIPFFAPLKKGSEDAAKAEGVKLTYTGISSSEVSPSAMSKVMTAAINQKPDALITCNFFPDVQRPLIKEAISQGIPVYVVEGDQKDADLGATSVFGMDNEAAGVRAAEELVRRAPSSRKVLCVNQLPEDPLVSARCEGLTKGLRAAGVAVETLNLADANVDQTRFVAGVQSALSTKSDIDVVIALGARQGEGVVLAAKGAGRESLKVATFDVSEQVLKDIEAGKTLFAVWQQPYINGYLPVVAAALHVKYGMSPPGVQPTGPLFISKDNLTGIKAARENGLM